MKNEKTNRFNWQGIIPRERSAIISFVMMIVVAFILGGLFLGRSGSGASVSGTQEHDHDASVSSEPTMWTCSMHPQIQLPKHGKCPICFMDLIPVEMESGSGELDPNQIRLSETAVKLAGIQTTPVTRAYAERAIRMVGKLAYDETKVSYITAWVPGRLDTLFVDFTGASVSRGDRMVYMYSPELIAAQEELLQAQKAAQALKVTSSEILRSTAHETLKSAREKLRLAGLSKDQIAAIEKEGVVSDHLTITAPAGGVVVHKDAKEGMYVSTGTRIYTIADLSELWVMLEAYESDLPWLRIGQRIEFSSPSFPGETFEAEISFIDPLVNPRTRTVDIRAVVKNYDGHLKPDMFVSGIAMSKLDNQGMVISGDDIGKAPLLIPASSPLITGKRAIVYVEIPSDEGVVYEGREIKLGPRAQDFYIVREGLEEAEMVVTNGAFKIDSELQIQAKSSMMLPQGKAEVAGHQQSGAGETKMADYKAGTAQRLDVGDQALSALTPVYKAYFGVQMALAKDDLEKSTEIYRELIEKVSDVDMDLFKDEAYRRWMIVSRAITDAAGLGTSAGSIVGARDAFFHLSLATIELHDTFGHAGDDPFYLTYCPMARDNSGAFWLQQEDIVWNSFFGAMMLRCGEIKQELHAVSAIAE